jgi:hypothetical protein
MMKPTERLREVIRDARRSIGAPDNAPAVANAIISGMWQRIIEDTDVHRLLMARGLNAEIRAFLTRHCQYGSDDARAVRAEQLSMWPTEARQCVEQINRERVWVPSRDEFVELAPDAVSPDEIREAGEYLLQHGADCIRRGRLLLRLAEMAPAPG